MVALSSFLSQPSTIIENANYDIIKGAELKTKGVMTRWYAHILTLPISARVSEGIAKMAGFDVLRHGTSFTNYLSILKNGGNPAFGGSKAGSTFAVSKPESNFFQRTEGHFYVFKDSVLNPIFRILTLTSPRLHAVLSGTTTAKAFIAKLLPDNVATRLVKQIVAISFGALNLLSPTVRFMYRSDEIIKENPVRFENDPDYSGLAYRTQQLLPNDRIGLIGLLKHIQFTDITKTFKNCPLCTLAGAVQVLAGVIFTSLGIGFAF